MKRMTRKQLDRAILKLYNANEPKIPRCVFPGNLYDYAWNLWAKSPGGRRELARRKRK